MRCIECNSHFVRCEDQPLHLLVSLFRSLFTLALLYRAVAQSFALLPRVSAAGKV